MKPAQHNEEPKYEARVLPAGRQTEGQYPGWTCPKHYDMLPPVHVASNQ